MLDARILSIGAVILLTGCKGGDAGGADGGAVDCNRSDACNMSDGELESCVTFATAIYGRATTEIEGSHGGNNGVSCAVGATISLTSASGTSQTTTKGWYALDVGPGCYNVCCVNAAANNADKCTGVDVGAGEKVQLDLSEFATPGGSQCWMLPGNDTGTCTLIVDAGDGG